jgi:hypothetical protein
MGTIIVPTGMLGVAGGLWADWDEASEDTLSVDQDGDGTEDTFICFFENTVAGGNETGRGVVSGADLVATQVHDVPGASGSPPRRELVTVSDGFKGTYPLFNTIIKDAANWTVIIKTYPTAVGQVFNYYLGAATQEQLVIWNDGQKFRPLIRTDGDIRLYASTANDLPLNQIVWQCAWYDGTTIYSGFATGSKPTKLSDFAANDRVSAVTANGVFINDADTNNYLLGRAGESFLGYGYYTLLSNVCLIDNDS